MKKVKHVLLILLVCSGATFSAAQNKNIYIKEDVTLDYDQVFQLIKTQTKYQFIYINHIVEFTPKVSISKGYIKTKDLLKKVLAPISCIHEFKDGQTIIVKKDLNNDLFTDNDGTFLNNNIALNFNGLLLDKVSNEPIPFANIGFIEKGIGTISNENGEFNLRFNSTLINTNALLKISVLGYETITLSGLKLLDLVSKECKLYINPEPFALETVTITNEKGKIVRIGNTDSNKTSYGYWKDREALGGEIAGKVQIRKKRTKLLKLDFNVLENLSDSVKVRINVYDYSKRYPGEKILKENIFKVIDIKQGIVSVDLKPYDVIVNDDIVVSIELIQVYGNEITFAVAAEPFSGIAFRRYISLDKWIRHEYMGISFSVLAFVPEKKRKQKKKEENKTTMN